MSSNKKINDLLPKNVWENFAQLCAIPRPSKHEEKIIAFMKNFGEQLGLDTIVDDSGNVIIKKPATAGMEKHRTVIFQGHLDMVPQKDVEVQHDFTCDPIVPKINGEWMNASGTTLGADNGIGVAIAMAILQAKDLAHPALECLFTIDEETGLTGAHALHTDILKGDILINLDTEEEGQLYIGCAGGVTTNVAVNYTAQTTPAAAIAFKINVTGLKGGHSGCDIHAGRANAIKLLNRILWQASNDNGLKLAHLASINQAHNVIPREAFAIVSLPADQKKLFEVKVKEFEKLFQDEFGIVEPDLKVSLESIALPAKVMEKNAQYQLLNALYACPHGVMRMSFDVADLVETSTNLAAIKTDEKSVYVITSQRSSIDSAKWDISNMVRSVFAPCDGKIEYSSIYPGWKPNTQSQILQVMQQIYQTKFGCMPKVLAIHAGLECGVLIGKYPKLDIISCGPTIENAHTTRERVNILSVKKLWEYLVEVLKNIPLK